MIDHAQRAANLLQRIVDEGFGSDDTKGDAYYENLIAAYGREVERVTWEKAAFLIENRAKSERQKADCSDNLALGITYAATAGRLEELTKEFKCHAQVQAVEEDKG